MAKRKRITLPKDFSEMLNTESMEALKAVFDKCELDAYSSFYKNTALHFRDTPKELICWLVLQGADVDVRNLYGETPLMNQYDLEKSALLIELGADIEAKDRNGNTALHIAARFYKVEILDLLIKHQANIHIENNYKQTPLLCALNNCRNIDIVKTSGIAEIFLNLGAIITDEMKKQVIKIGKEFEFGRPDFNIQYLEETDAGLLKLYQLFDVPPVPRRVVHDGVSQIAAKTDGWENQYNELWEFLIPSTGAAYTVQGEVIRIIGRVRDEMYRNGGGNWDADYQKMVKVFVQFLKIGVPLSLDELEEAELFISHSDDLSIIERMCELSVKWVQLNPDPMILEKPNYKR